MMSQPEIISIVNVITNEFRKLEDFIMNNPEDFGDVVSVLYNREGIRAILRSSDITFIDWREFLEYINKR